MIDKKKLLNDLKEEVHLTLEMFERFDLKNDQYCVMPFATLILEPNGDIGGCRHKGTEFVFGNITQNTIEEIWTSKKMQDWRNEYLDGTPIACKTELVDRRCNLCPELNKLLPHADRKNIKNPKVLRFTANMNGKCNLECQMCHVWRMPNGFYTEENFWIPARKTIFPEILEMDLLSGEPFIQKDTFRLIDEVSALNSECVWTFTTNLHWALSKSIKASLDKIKIKNIIVSIDSLEEETFSKIRLKGDLKFALRNLEALIEYEKERLERGLSGINIRFNCLIQKDNWKEVRNVINYCLEKEIPPFLTFLYEPLQYSLLDLEYEQRINILEFYFKNLSKDEINFNLRVIKPLIRSLERFDYIYYLNRLKENLGE